jgi:serine/threonine-protein kinase
VHRDIKPGNLLVAAGGTTKITDFGIATAVRAAQAPHLTETGMVMGTALYVSPEQATGAPVTAASDIYSLGVVGYECLAGRPPFTASEPLAIAFAHKHEPVPPLPPDVPEQVSDLVYHMLAKTPDGRPASVRAVADRADVLREALAAGDITLAAEGPRPTRADLPAARTGPLLGAEDPYLAGRPRAGRRRGLAAAGVTAALCVAAAGTGLYLTSHAGQPHKDVGSNTAQHLSSPAVAPSPTASQPATPTPTSRVVVNQPAPTATASASPRPTRTQKPTASPTPTMTSASPTASPTNSATPSPTQTSASPSPSSSSTSP